MYSLPILTHSHILPLGSWEERKIKKSNICLWDSFKSYDDLDKSIWKFSGRDLYCSNSKHCIIQSSISKKTFWYHGDGSHVVYSDTEEHHGWEQHENIVSILLLELSVFKIFYFWKENVPRVDVTKGLYIKIYPFTLVTPMCVYSYTRYTRIPMNFNGVKLTTSFNWVNIFTRLSSCMSLKNSCHSVNNGICLCFIIY